MRRRSAMTAVILSGGLFALALLTAVPARADMALLAPTLTRFSAAEDVYLAQARRAGIQQLRASVAMYSEEAPIVLRDAPGGYIDYFNPPATSPAVVQTASPGSGPGTLALAFVQEHADAFGLNSEHIALSVQSVAASGANTVVRLAQYHAGAPVFGASILVHVTPDGRIACVWTDTLRTLPGIDESILATPPTLTAQQAAQCATSAMQERLAERIAESRTDIAAARDQGALSSEQADAAMTALGAIALEAPSAPVQMVLDPLVLGLDGPARRVWTTTVRSAGPALVNEQVLVDAHTGEVALTVGQTKNLPLRLILDSNFEERMVGASPSATVVRFEGGPPATGFTSPKSNDDINLNYTAFGQAYDYFNTHHGLDSFDGEGAYIYSHVFWNSTPHAAWDNATGYFMFGNGNCARADDIVGHEYTHAVLDRAIGLTNVGESAAIIESLANMWGEFIDWSAGGDSQTNRWQIGEDLANGPIYHMNDPSLDVDPITGNGRPTDRASSWWCDDDNDPQMPAINSGIGDKMIQLLTDGGSFNGHHVTGLGSTYVSTLFWEALNSHIPASPDYVDLCQALFDAANALSIIMPCPEVAEIRKAAEAVGLQSDTYQYGYTLPKAVAYSELHVFTSSTTALTSDGYHRKKAIPYKIYIPKEDESLGDRGTVTYPLDVIILVHGGGMDRDVASGTKSDDDQTYIDGLAVRWAKAGYIVVCPTFRKRLLSGGTYWEWPWPVFPMVRLVSDAVRIQVTNPEEYLVDRFRDVKFICDRLDSTLNDKVTGCYSPTTSQIALAGHSWGTPVVLLAAGARVTRYYKDVLPLPVTDAEITVDLADHGFSRVASGPSPFIDAAAFMLLSSGETLQEENFTAFDPSDPAFHGKDYIQRPLLAMIGGNDFIKDNSPNGGLRPGQNGFSAEDTDWFPSVTKAVGLNHAPAYGVVIDGANHVTPVSEFAGMPSWNFGTFWNWFNSVTSGAGGANTKLALPLQLRTSEEHNVLQLNDVADLIIDTVQGMLPSLPVVTEAEELDRLEAFETYSRSFWDVFLSPEYDLADDGYATAYFQLSNDDHEVAAIVLDFDRSSPGAFTIRDDSGLDLVHFHNDGGILLLKGTLTTGATIAQTDAQEFIIRDTSGTIAAKIDASTGNLYIKGSLTENVPDLRTTSSHEFIVRNALEISRPGDADKARILLDTSGNLKLVREVYSAITP